MAGVQSTEINQGFNWKTELSELYSVGKALGQEYISSRVAAQKEASTQKVADRAMQRETAARRVDTQNIIYLGVAAAVIFFAVGIARKQRII